MGCLMTLGLIGTRKFMVSPNAINKLTELRNEFNKALHFRVFYQEKNIQLRIHDKEYNGDWMIDIHGIGISFCQDILKNAPTLILDCIPSTANKSGFDFILTSDSKIQTRVDGDEVIARIKSQPTEICDIYQEFCYEGYTLG